MNQMKDALERGLKAMGADDKEKQDIGDMFDGVLKGDADGNRKVVDMAARRQIKDQKNDMHFRNKGRF